MNEVPGTVLNMRDFPGIGEMLCMSNASPKTFSNLLKRAKDMMKGVLSQCSYTYDWGQVTPRLLEGKFPTDKNPGYYSIHDMFDALWRTIEPSLNDECRQQYAAFKRSRFEEKSYIHPDKVYPTFSAAFKEARLIVIKELGRKVTGQDWSKLTPATLRNVNFEAFPAEDYRVPNMIDRIWERLLLASDEIRKIDIGIHIPTRVLQDVYIEAREKARRKGALENSIQLIPVHNFFRTVKATVSLYGCPDIESHFTNSQAAEICSRMASGWARAVARKYEKTDSGDFQKNLYELHAIAEKALKIYGPHLLSFIITLPSLRFQDRNAIEVRSYKFVRPDFPLLTFQQNSGERISIGFFVCARRKFNGSFSYKPDVQVFSKKFERLGTLDRKGRLITQIEKFRPLLSLFFSAGKEGYQLYSGVTTGLCVICNRPLSHPDSLRIGIGPVCARDIGFDREIYGGRDE